MRAGLQVRRTLTNARNDETLSWVYASTHARNRQRATGIARANGQREITRANGQQETRAHNRQRALGDHPRHATPQLTARVHDMRNIGFIVQTPKTRPHLGFCAKRLSKRSSRRSRRYSATYLSILGAFRRTLYTDYNGILVMENKVCWAIVALPSVSFGQNKSCMI